MPHKAILFVNRKTRFFLRNGINVPLVDGAFRMPLVSRLEDEILLTKYYPQFPAISNVHVEAKPQIVKLATSAPAPLRPPCRAAAGCYCGR